MQLNGVFSLFQSQIALFQRLDQSDGQRRGDGNGDDGVENGGGDLAGNGGKTQSGRSTLLGKETGDQERLEEIEDVVSNGAQHSADQVFGIASFVAVAVILLDQLSRGNTGHQTQSALGKESDPALSSIDRVGEIIEGGAQTGGQSADGAENQAREGAMMRA